MRFMVILSLLVSLCAPASAARVHHSRLHSPKFHSHVIGHPNHEEVVPPGWYKFPGYPPIPPEENRNLDASTRGSA
jgi:hypothetical protein